MGWLRKLRGEKAEDTASTNFDAIKDSLQRALGDAKCAVVSVAPHPGNPALWVITTSRNFSRTKLTDIKLNEGKGDVPTADEDFVVTRVADNTLVRKFIVWERNLRVALSAERDVTLPPNASPQR